MQQHAIMTCQEKTGKWCYNVMLVMSTAKLVAATFPQQSMDLALSKPASIQRSVPRKKSLGAISASTYLLLFAFSVTPTQQH